MAEPELGSGARATPSRFGLFPLAVPPLWLKAPPTWVKVPLLVRVPPLRSKVPPVTVMLSLAATLIAPVLVNVEPPLFRLASEPELSANVPWLSMLPEIAWGVLQQPSVSSVPVLVSVPPMYRFSPLLSAELPTWIVPALLMSELEVRLPELPPGRRSRGSDC